LELLHALVVNGDIGGFHVIFEVLRCTVVGAKAEGAVVAGEDDGGGAVGVDVGVKGIADPQQVSRNSQ
jgi:hypothetical protein